MSSDPYYKTKHWRDLRAERLRIDMHTRVVPGCNAPAYAVTAPLGARRDRERVLSRTGNALRCLLAVPRRHGQKVSTCSERARVGPRQGAAF